jgi:7-cyano-7-deazaguanine reductase
MNTPEQSQLGKSSAYIDQYDASLLFPIPRAGKRSEMGITDTPLFFGADMWTAYELSWLNLRGKPQVALAHIHRARASRPTSSRASLSSSTSTASTTPALPMRAMCVSACVQTSATPVAPAHPGVGIKTIGPELFDREPVHETGRAEPGPARCGVQSLHACMPELLFAEFDEAPVTEVLTSNLLKSNCLVTGQPDWGSVQISYTGPQINQEGLLQYLVSFRNHNEFHEQCVERIFMDVWTRCKPIKLSVYARYTRRGGLDINPFRTSHPQALPHNVRTARQ